jgi:hypothetical protein
MLRYAQFRRSVISVVTVPWFWGRAARYGVSLRLAQPGLELFRLALLVLALLVSAITLAIAGGKAPSLPSALWVGVGVGLIVTLVVCSLIRYFGNLSRIMEVAAWSDEGASRLRRDMALGMRNVNAYKQLIDLYEPIREEANKMLGSSRGLEPVKTPDGAHQYAAVAIAAARGERLEGLIVDPICEGRNASFHRLADSRQRLMRKWRDMDGSKRKLEDERGDNYCLAELGLDHENGALLHLKVGVATYGEIVRSCDALINEFALYSFLAGPFASRRRASTRTRRSLPMSPTAMLRCLPWRHRVHRDACARPRDIRRHRLSSKRKPAPGANLFLKPHDRAAGIGVAVVTLDRQDDGEHFYLGMRSGVVGTYPSTNHVIPAGMCNTYGTDLASRMKREPPPADYLSTAMKCEFIEEWFDVKEFQDNKRQGWSERVNTHWKKKMRERTKSRQSPTLTGIAFDLLNLRPEVCATAVVEAKEGVLNWEFDSIGFEGPLSEIGSIGPTEIVQSGAAALWLAQESRLATGRPTPSAG